MKPAVNGQKVAGGRIVHTVPNVFSANEGADVGVDEATPVTDAYKEATIGSPARSTR